MPPRQVPCVVSNQDKLISRGVYKAFAYNETLKNIDHIQSDTLIRLLTKKDKMIVSLFNEEIHSNMIPLDSAFDEFVLNDNGEIYVYMDSNGRIIGYLSCAPEADNIWDVVYIYVQPEYRSCGIGTRLASHYLRAKIQSNQIPYYSGVTNPASEAAAVKAGFTLCRERYSYEYHGLKSEKNNSLEK